MNIIKSENRWGKHTEEKKDGIWTFGKGTKQQSILIYVIPEDRIDSTGQTG